MRSLTATITDGRHVPLQQLPVMLVNALTQARVSSGITDNDGRIQFTSLTEGDYYVRPLGYLSKPVNVHYNWDLNVRELMEFGNIGDRPASGRTGRLFYAVDEDIVYLDIGVAWVKIATHLHSGLDGIGTDDHHAKSHVHTGDGSGTVAHSSLSGVTANQHHNQAHALDGADHTGTLSIAQAASLIQPKWKSSGSTTNNDDTLSDDADLTFAIGAGEIWQFMIVVYVGASAGDVKFGINAPVDAVGRWGAGYDTADAVGSAYTTSLPGSVPFTIGSTTRQLIITGVINNPTNAGNVTLQWAQNVSDAAILSIHSGSHLIAHRIS